MRASIARGTRSDVFLAYDRRLERDVAVKLLDGNATPAILESFRRDMLALASLDSDHVATVFDVVVGDGVAFAVLRHREGEPLDRVLATERAHEPTRAARFALDVLRGLQAVRRHRLSCDLALAHVVLAEHRAYLFGVKARPPTDEAADVARCGLLFLQLVLGRADVRHDELDRTFPAAFGAIIAAAIAPPLRRYPSLAEMTTALGGALRQMDALPV
ncbi:MAG: hypothetical protein NT062_16110 [Proteobacteria bacterium]|nr:hypothetical protein [Pseudomonadota bacterium]